VGRIHEAGADGHVDGIRTGPVIGAVLRLAGQVYMSLSMQP
jgi:hypothetical protein